MGFALHRLPASAFGVVLGTAGQASLWRALSAQNVTSGPLRFLQHLPNGGLSMAFWLVALTMFLSVAVMYIGKAVYRWRAVVWEFSSSIHVNFFFMPLLIILVMGVSAPSQLFPSSTMPIAVFYIVMVILLGLETWLYTEWMYGVSRSLAWANPAYQLSIVGNIIGAGVAAQLGDKAMSIFLFAIGVLYLLLTLCALHTTKDIRAWVGSSNLNQEPAAMTDRSRACSTWLGGRRSTPWLGSAVSLAGNSSGHVLLQANIQNNGSVVYNNHVESPEPSVQDAADILASSVVAPEDQQTQPILARGDSDVEVTQVEKALDLVTTGEVHTMQYDPRSINIWSLPAALQPTLFLYVAPPSLSAISWCSIQGGKVGTGSCDAVCQSFASLGIFFFLLMVCNLPRFLTRTPFSLAFWAFTFPSSALALAGVEFAVATGSVFLHGFSAFLVFLSSVIYFSVLVATAVQVIRRGIDILLLPNNVPR